MCVESQAAYGGAAYINGGLASLSNCTLISNAAASAYPALTGVGVSVC
jgi:hypothetical protein